MVTILFTESEFVATVCSGTKKSGMQSGWNNWKGKRWSPPLQNVSMESSMPQRESKKIKVETCLTSKEKRLQYMTLFEIILFYFLSGTDILVATENWS